MSEQSGSSKTPAKATSKSKSKEVTAAHSRGGSYVSEGSDEALEKGYWGARPNVHDDEEFALTSGPDSPGANPDPDNDGYLYLETKS